MFVRTSDDNESNTFGKKLLDLCSMFNCVLLNGLRQFDFDDSLTFVSTSGGSTIDYFIMSRDICSSHFVCSLRVLSFVDSSHFHVSLMLCCQTNANTLHNYEGDKPKWISKMIWDETVENIFF
jgi:hypothetical protein